MKKEIKAFEFIDREGKLVQPRREDHYPHSPIGKAYGFFYCNASKQEIETELPTIRELVKTPSQLELSLIEGMDNVKGDSKLIFLAQVAKQNSMNYMLQATYPNATHKKTADEVAGILNQAYQSPLYEAGEPFRGRIVYEEKSKYVFRD